MTAKEDIEAIDDVLSSEYHYDETLGYQLTSDDFEWLENAKSALEKQIPKKPIDVRTPVVTWGLCPVCKGELNKLGGNPNRVFSHMNYCPDCGQRIDWSEGNE